MKMDILAIKAAFEKSHKSFDLREDDYGYRDINTFMLFNSFKKALWPLRKVNNGSYSSEKITPV